MTATKKRRTSRPVPRSGYTPRKAHPRPKNPHGRLIALDPPRDHPPRRWECSYCGVKGLMGAVQKIECSYAYPPCKFCGKSGECARDCSGMMALLGGNDPSVYVTGMPPKDLTKCAPCRGYGFHPTKNKKLWPPGARPDAIGYVFVSCRDCGGTGRKSNAAEA